MKYTSKNNQFGKTKILLVSLISFFISNAHAVTINGYPGLGFVPVGQFTGSVNVPSGFAFNETTAKSAGFGFANITGGGDPCTANQNSWKTIDGYYGFEVGTGVLMVIYDGSITGQVVSSTGGANNVNGFYTLTGVLSGTIPPKSNAVNCYSYLSGSRTTSTATRTTITGKYGYYISADAALTTATGISASRIGLRRSGGTGTTAGNYTVINEGDRIIILTPPVTCTVSTTSLVNFGDISQAQATGGQGVISESHLSVNCTKEAGGESISYPITYSIKPKTQSGDTTTIPLISSSGGTVGNVRGFLGATASADAGCVDRASSVPMNGTQVPLRTITSSESWSDPLFWVLCPQKDANPGPATATATLEVSW